MNQSYADEENDELHDGRKSLYLAQFFNVTVEDRSKNSSVFTSSDYTGKSGQAQEEEKLWLQQTSLMLYINDHNMGVYRKLFVTSFNALSKYQRVHQNKRKVLCLKLVDTGKDMIKSVFTDSRCAVKIANQRTEFPQGCGCSLSPTLFNINIIWLATPVQVGL